MYCPRDALLAPGDNLFPPRCPCKRCTTPPLASELRLRQGQFWKFDDFREADRIQALIVMRYVLASIRILVVFTDHVLASHTTFFNFQVHRSDFVHVTTRTSHDDGFIEIGAGFIVHGFSLFPARRFFYNGFSCWIQFNRRTSENHYVFTRTKKTVLQFL